MVSGREFFFCRFTSCTLFGQSKAFFFGVYFKALALPSWAYTKKVKWDIFLRCKGLKYNSLFCSNKSVRGRPRSSRVQFVFPCAVGPIGPKPVSFPGSLFFSFKGTKETGRTWVLDWPYTIMKAYNQTLYAPDVAVFRWQWEIRELSSWKMTSLTLNSSTPNAMMRLVMRSVK